MKMALLEKYLIKRKGESLLCNKLKKRWRDGAGLVHTDPYVLLFSEVIKNYSNNPGVRKIVELCFFLKLGIRSMQELDYSVLKIRKKMITKCAELFLWNLETLYDSGYFSEWPYERIAALDSDIKAFMISTYRHVSGVLNQRNSEEALITAEDLTILGRRMFVQFSERPEKVETLPAVAERVPLFTNLYLFYRKKVTQAGNVGTWEVYRENKKIKREAGNEDAVLKNAKHIEEVAAWLVHNGLNTRKTQIHLLPNPTFITSQDIDDLLKNIDGFFQNKEDSEKNTSAFLQKEYIKKILITANFSCSRKHRKIVEYTAIYMTTWGEFCAKPFDCPGGLNSLETAFDKACKIIGLELIAGKAGGFVPRMSRKKIMAGEGVLLL
jgi:adenylate cyclase class 1